LAHAFLDCGQELARDRPAFHRIDELETFATRQGFDAQEHFAELARAARLLLVAMMSLSRRPYGFAVGDTWRTRGDLQAMPFLQSIQIDAQMQVG